MIGSSCCTISVPDSADVRGLRKLVQRAQLFQPSTLQGMLIDVVERDRDLRGQQLGLAQLGRPVGGLVAGVDAHQHPLHCVAVGDRHSQQRLGPQQHVQEAVAEPGRGRVRDRLRLATAHHADRQ